MSTWLVLYSQMNIDDLNQFQLLYYSFITVTVFLVFLHKHLANFSATESKGERSKNTVWEERLETIYIHLCPNNQQDGHLHCVRSTF